MKPRFYLLTAAIAMAAALLCSSANAIERIAGTPYTGDAANLKTINLSLPTCAADEALTSLGGNTFTCVSVKDALPPCGGTQALAVSGNSFVCASVVQNAPTCADGYSLQGDGGTSLSCVKTTLEVPTCSSSQALTTDQGKLVCVTLPAQNTPPSCGAGQALTAQNGTFSCVQISQTSCDGRVVQSWGGMSYCSNISCANNQMLTMVNGYMQCSDLPAAGNIEVSIIGVQGRKYMATAYVGTWLPTACPDGYSRVSTTYINNYYDFYNRNKLLNTTWSWNAAGGTFVSNVTGGSLYTESGSDGYKDSYQYSAGTSDSMILCYKVTKTN